MFNLKVLKFVFLKFRILKNLSFHPLSTWPQGYKTFFMLNSTEHKISTAQKTKIPTNEEVSCFKYPEKFCAQLC